MGEEEQKAWPPELRKTLKLAGPIVLGNLGQVLIGVVDTLMIGRLGVVPLGASAFVNNVFVVPLVTLMGLLAAVTILVSQSKGAGDERQVGRHIRHGLVLTLVVSAIVCGIMAGNSLWLDRYGQEPEVIAASRTYYWLIVASLVPALVYQCLKCVWEGLGWSNPPMLVLLAGIGLNVLLNWLLIFGAMGFPELGLEGAGWATLIARTLIAASLFALTLKARRFASYLPRRWLSGYDRGGFAKMLRLGLPMGAQHMFEVGAFAGAGIMVGWLSAEALAAHQVALSCAATAFMIPLGVSIACGIRVGERFGSGNYGSIKVIYQSALGFTFLQTLLSALFFLLCGRWMAGLFVENEAVVSLAASIFVIVGLFQLFDGAQVTCLGALRGMSDVNTPMLITLFTYWILALPLGYALGFLLEFGALGVWAGLACGLLTAAVSLHARLRRRVAEYACGVNREDSLRS